MSPARRRRVRSLTALVAVVMVAVTILAAGAARQNSSSSEHKLLKQRADELQLAVTDAIQSTTSRLTQFGVLTRVGADPVQAFQTVVRAEGTSGARELALLRPQGGRLLVVAAVGPDLEVGAAVSAAVADAASDAVAARTFATTPVLHLRGGKVIGVALGPPQAPAGYVVYQELAIQPSSASRSQAATTGPFGELAVAVYDGRSADPRQLVLDDGLRSGTGPSVASQVKIGASPFLILTAARMPLIGGVQRNAQWYVLGSGLALAVLVAVLFDFAQRRRYYALELVEERTAALNQSLEALREAQGQLVEQERLAAIGQLASTVGHELRNPMAVVSNTLYLLRRATSGTEDDRVTQNLDIADRELAAATRIVADLLEFSRHREPLLGAVDLGDLVDEALTVAPRPDNVLLTWDRPRPPVRARADRDQLRQVILNLVTNAYDAMPEGGALRVEARAGGDGTAVLAVADTGSGIDATIRARIFEPFFTTRARGTGLGLAVTARIVATHGGTIAVDSDPGAGSTFTVVLPAAETDGNSP
jgi:signal transduction histidine kinase